VRISVVINTLNESENIEACIDSVKDFADEVLVCDMHSDDDTVSRAECFGARIILHDRTGFVEPARKFAIEHAAYDWVLVLDADERMTAKLADELKRIASEGRYEVVSFWSLYWYFGGWVRHGGFFNGNWRRFFLKNTYLSTYNSSEEQVHMNFDSLRGHPSTCKLSNKYFMLHYAYPTVEKYLCKTLGRYAAIEGQQYSSLGRSFSLFRMLWEPPREFLARFILRQGFRDGMRGFILACLYSGFRFCVWANRWECQSSFQPGRSDDPPGISK